VPVLWRLSVKEILQKALRLKTWALKYLWTAEICRVTHALRKVPGTFTEAAGEILHGALFFARPALPSKNPTIDYCPPSSRGAVHSKARAPRAGAEETRRA
jgi:hypothetical protein